MSVRTALVAGGGPGIGAGIAAELAAAGYQLALVDRDAEAAERVAEQVQAAVQFFIAEDADFITGQVIYVGGGPHG